MRPRGRERPPSSAAARERGLDVPVLGGGRVRVASTSRHPLRPCRGQRARRASPALLLERASRNGATCRRRPRRWSTTRASPWPGTSALGSTTPWCSPQHHRRAQPARGRGARRDGGPRHRHRRAPAAVAAPRPTGRRRPADDRRDARARRGAAAASRRAGVGDGRVERDGEVLPSRPSRRSRTGLTRAWPWMPRSCCRTGASTSRHPASTTSPSRDTRPTRPTAPVHSSAVRTGTSARVPRGRRRRRGRARRLDRLEVGPERHEAGPPTCSASPRSPVR